MILIILVVAAIFIFLLVGVVVYYKRPIKYSLDDLKYYLGSENIEEQKNQSGETVLLIKNVSLADLMHLYKKIKKNSGRLVNKIKKSIESHLSQDLKYLKERGIYVELSTMNVQITEYSGTSDFINRLVKTSYSLPGIFKTMEVDYTEAYFGNPQLNENEINSTLIELSRVKPQTYTFNVNV